MNKGGVAAFEEAAADFVDKFGRKPGRRDRVLTGSYRLSPADYERMFVETATLAGIRPEIIYASKSTGLILSERNIELSTPADLDEWHDAIDAYLLALEEGVDLLNPPPSPMDNALVAFDSALEKSVIHFGSYADRAPRKVRTSLPAFFQFLLVARIHQTLKSFSDFWNKRNGDETYAVFRTVYECSLIIQRLDYEPSYSRTLLAQSLAGSEVFPFRLKKNGRNDFGKLIDVETGEEHEARTSFAKCAAASGEENLAFFNIIYPILSNQIHFDAADMMRKYRSNGTFLLWQESKPGVQALFAVAVLTYAITVIGASTHATGRIRRDCAFMINNY